MRILSALVLLLLATPASWAVGIGAPLENLPVQDGGRVKPYDTFARESLKLIYGKAEYNGRAASELVFTWMIVPEHWREQPIIEIRHNGLKEALKLESSQRYFTPQSMMLNERISLVLQELQNLRSRQEKLNPYYQAVQRLESQLGMFQAIGKGQALRLVPRADSDVWQSPVELTGEVQAAFDKLAKSFVDSIAAAAPGSTPQATPEFIQNVNAFIEIARAQAPEKYADSTRIKWEVHLNHFHPFAWAWMAYLASVLLLIAANGYNIKVANYGMWAALIVAFGLHTYGMALRIYLAGRPPVSNMYETVVWVPWGAVLFALILRWAQKNQILLACASAIAMFCLILTDLAPTVLDASIQPLEPVLRSTFWLTTHVLIITISYAAFFLAFAVGNLLLFYYLRDEKRFAKQIQSGTQSIYRSIQIGVVLLAAGIILGGIWADYSWGRFWGWDPKETWALIALLGYIALLHGRLVGWVRNFELASGSVIAFSLFIMAWYGVNYVLGAGLHSYGFGAGGIENVIFFLALQFMFVTYVSTVRYSKSKT
jgi:cytochrome c-type biogenesis protein CcsB